jgi:hypothetical protein
MEIFSLSLLPFPLGLTSSSNTFSILLLITIALFVRISVAVLSHMATFLFPRKNQYLEKFPFANTIEMVQNQHKILEYIKEVHDDLVERDNGRRTFVVKSLGMPPMVFTNCVKNVTHILKTNFENYGKSGESFKTKFQGLLGDGIFNADGHQWYVHRKTSSHMFKQQKFKTTILQIFNDELDIVVGLLNSYKGKAFDFQTLVANFTIDSIGKVAFGRDLGTLIRYC